MTYGAGIIMAPFPFLTIDKNLSLLTKINFKKYMNYGKQSNPKIRGHIRTKAYVSFV